MFRKSNKEPQFDAFGSVPAMLGEGAYKQYNDKNHWHNQFREQVVRRFDETIFKVLFNEKMGAPNAPISMLLGMMVLKDAFAWSDWQLFEQCRFNLLVRSALGLFNINDSIPAESTYYLLRRRLYDYQKQNGEDLFNKAFEQVTQEQVKEFDVNGQRIRMDSKLIGGNIAYFTRYEIIHQTLCRVYKTLSNRDKFKLSESTRNQLEAIVNEESNKTVYRSSKEEIKIRLQILGALTYNILNVFIDHKSEQYQLLQRVFGEQYKVIQDNQIELRTKEEISSGSVQSPHDPDCAYRNKNNKPVKGYSINLTETCSDDQLNLITNVKVDKANVPDTSFVKDAILSTNEVTGQKVEKVHLDGAYHSPENDVFCDDQHIDLILTGLQGFASRYDLEMTQDGLIVTDTLTGKSMKAVLAKKIKQSSPDRWRIKVNGKPHYFLEQAINASYIRRKLTETPVEELNKRNNAEASLFHLSYPLRNNKTRYRGQFKQQMWAYGRGLWINCVRISNFIKQTCQRTPNEMEIPAFLSQISENIFHIGSFFQKLSFRVSILINRSFIKESLCFY